MTAFPKIEYDSAGGSVSFVCGMTYNDYFCCCSPGNTYTKCDWLNQSYSQCVRP